MVQRNAVSKLGIQSESKNHVKYEKRLSMARKPSTQYQDIRSKGGSDLTKIMKKARPSKTSDLERRERARFNKPSINLPQKKSSQFNITSRQPNYMKPTSSSDARRESLQVSPYFQASVKNKNPKNSNHSPKDSSINRLKKLTKVLSKMPTLKPVRPSMKKTSGAALYPKMNVNRATCSSTLKDSKFPAYVMLHPGGTEAVGTSVVKVCPYTYCSLNGHHHAPLSPLKRFLSARRRLLKTQKNMKLRGLSSPRIKGVGERKNDIDTGQMSSYGDPIVYEATSDGLGDDYFVEIYAKSKEEISDFELMNYNGGKSIHDHDEKPKFEFDLNVEALEDIPMVGYDEIAQGYYEGTEVQNEEAGEGAAGSQISEISLQDSLDYGIDPPEGIPQFTEHHWYAEAPDAAETGYDGCTESDEGGESESTATSEVDESVADASDMDWEDDIMQYPNNGGDYSTCTADGSQLIMISSFNDGLAFNQDESLSTCKEAASEKEILQGVASGDQSSEIDASSTASSEESDASSGPKQNQHAMFLYLDNTQVEATIMDWQDGITQSPDNGADSSTCSDDGSHSHLIVISAFNDEIAFNQDSSVSTCREAPSEVEILQEVASGDQSSEIDVSSSAAGEGSNASSGPNNNQLAMALYLDHSEVEPDLPAQNDQNRSVKAEENGAGDIYSSCLSASLEDMMEKPTETGKEIPGDAEATDFCQGNALSSYDDEGNIHKPVCSTDMANESMAAKPENSLEDDLNTAFPTDEKDVSSCQMHPDLNAEVLPPPIESQTSKSIDAEAEQDMDGSDSGPVQDLPSGDIEDEMVRTEPVEVPYSLVQIQAPSETNQDIDSIDQTPVQTNAENEYCQHDEKIQEIECNEEASDDQNSIVLDQSISPAAYCSSDDQSDVHKIVKNRENSGKDQTHVGGKLISCSTAHNEEESSSTEDHFGMNGKMQMEDITKSNTAETCLVAGKGKTFIHAGKDINPPLPKTCINRKVKINIAHKWAMEDEDQVRTFNPRAPRFLEIEPEPEAERVDLRHQMMDERKNSEEWMLDYALQQTVSKLAPARKRKVALLVEAFEQVMPLPQFETHLQHQAASFTHARPIQACS